MVRRRQLPLSWACTSLLAASGSCHVFIKDSSPRVGPVSKEGAWNMEFFLKSCPRNGKGTCYKQEGQVAACRCEVCAGLGPRG